jgi:hypothetical protein
MMSMFAIYDHPRDFPEHFVVREWLVAKGLVVPMQEYALASTLDEARAEIPPGMVLIPRFENDDPKIVEVWA